MVKTYRNHLDDLNFIEINSSKLQGGATESGASVFQVNYFGRPAFLAQSPQLAKQMCIAADMDRVYEIGPVFRAENSNTHRHMTEFIGLDIEMQIREHYHECLEVIDGVLKRIFEEVVKGEKWTKDRELVKKLYPHEDLVWLKETLVLKYNDGVKLLREDGAEVGDYEDFDTPTEKRLGAIVKKKYGTDYYILGESFTIRRRALV